MPDRRILLTKEQIETLSKQFVDKLQKIPPSRTDAKRELISEYIKKVQDMIANNIKNFTNDFSDCDCEKLKIQIVRDILLS